MTKNKMAELAKIFGKKINEEFQVADENNLILPDKFFYRFNEKGLQFSHGGVWKPSNILELLLEGKYQIKEEPWKAKNDEIYFVPLITSVDNYTRQRVTGGIDNMMYNRGLMCKTPEQAEELSELLIQTARQFQGFEEDFEEEE